MSALRRNGAVVGALMASDFEVAWSYRASFFFGLVTPFAAVLLFYFVSRIIGSDSVVGSPDEYFQFVVMGVALSSVAEDAADAAAQSARAAQVKGTLEAIVCQPVSPTALAFGWTAFPVVESVLRAILIVLLAIPLGLQGTSPDWVGVVVVLVLSGVVFAAVGIIGCALVIAFQQGAGVVGLAMGLLAILSGALFPVSVFPPALEWLSQLSPLRYALDAMRAVALDGQSVADIATELAVLTGFAVVLLPLGAVMISRGLNHARRVGGLGRF